jgi:hypothetical protein
LQVVCHRGFDQKKLYKAKLWVQTCGNVTSSTWFPSHSVPDVGIPPPKWKLSLQAM